MSDYGKQGSLDPLEAKMNFMQKYGWKGTVVLVLSMIAPYGVSAYDAYITKKNTELTTKIIRQELAPFQIGLMNIGAKLDQNMVIAVNSHAKKLLNADDIIYVAKNAVGMQSIIKIKELKAYLNNSQYDTRKFKENRIKYILIMNSKIYIKELNRFVHPKIGRAGNYILNNFDMDMFLKDVYVILLDDNVSSVDKKCDNLMQYMVMTVQEDFFNKMAKDMK